MRYARRNIPLEVPPFGLFARHFAGVSSDDLACCLADQRASGRRIGQILESAKLITPAQRVEILRRQAHWAAQMRSADISPRTFPLSTPLSLCLPCFNEAEVIQEVLLGACAVLPYFLEEFEIVVVDDGSRDDTALVVERIAARNARVRLVRHEHNLGYGAAVATGLKAARGEWICFTDGDGQFNMLDLPQLLVEAHAADIVVGYRYRRADNPVRQLSARGWKWLIRALVGVRVRDLDCAFKLFPRWVVDRLQLTADGACISAEIMAQCFRGGAKIVEVPVNHFPRAAGKATGGNLKVIAKAFRELPIVWKYRRMQPWRREQSSISLGAQVPPRSAIYDGSNEKALCNELSNLVESERAGASER